MKRVIAVFLIAVLIAGCGKQRQNGIKSDTVVDAVGKGSNPAPTPSPSPSPSPNMKDLPALPEPVEETNLKIPWAKVIITAVVWAFLWGLVQKNKEPLRDRISRLGFWSDVYWGYLKSGYYWLCLNGPGVHSWLPEPKNDPEFDEYKLSRPGTPLVVYSSRPYVDEYWWRKPPAPEPPPAPDLPPNIRPIQDPPAEELNDLNFDDLFGNNLVIEEEIAERVTRSMQTAERNIQAISKWVKWQETEEKQALAESVELPPEPPVSNDDDTDPKKAKLLKRPKKPSDDLRFDDLFGDDERVYDNEEVKLQRMQELLTEIDGTLSRIEIKCDSLRNWRSPEVVPVELDFDFFD